MFCLSSKNLLEENGRLNFSYWAILDTCACFCYQTGVRRELLKDISRVVVKLGTGVLTDSRKQPDLAQLEQLVAQIAAQRKAGKEVVMVTSGAVGAGMGALGYEKRPVELAEQQACAAVGQSRLMAIYEKLFAKHDLHVAQVLLTHDDLEHHDRHLNARNTLVTLLRLGVVPIINENDAVSFTEIKFGDNDKLSALVASLLPADLLIILTTVDGVIENFGKADPKTISIIEHIDGAIEKMAGGTDSTTAVGGMRSKIEAAKIVVRSGIPLVIASGKKKNMFARVLAGEEEGTLFVPQSTKLQGRKRWIAFFHYPKGALFVDEGAKQALREKGKSLLPPGIARCEGSFAAEDVVRICDLNGTEFARGIAAFGSAEISARTLQRVEVVHRDNLVIL
jgi:glutamate 5-kinase